MTASRTIVAIAAVAVAALGAFAEEVKVGSSNEMETRTFSIERPEFECVHGKDPSLDWREGDWKAYLWKSASVSWPKGSSLRILDSGDLEITNRPEELDLIADRFSSSRYGDSQGSSLFVCTHFVVAPREALDACGWDVAAPPKDAAKLLKSLLSRSDVKIAAELSSPACSGVNMVLKSVKEITYPTDYYVRVSPSPLNCDTNAVRRAPGSGVGFAVCEPQSFQMRETGFIVDVTPNVSDDGTTLFVEMNSQFVGEPTWKDYGMRIPAAGGKAGGYDLPMRQPFFPVTQFYFRYSTTLGRTHVFAAPMPDGDTSRTMLLFVRIDLLN